ncbi:MAG: YajQ family cyclic di-GMP-binding protein [Coriobacteriia bacterium]|nr:YajQ family cyclic di-GMP-binding protein [Coriobacteriia bacterium]
MAKDSSFDVVSQVDMQEIDNAFGQATKEMKQRYDLKGTNSKIDLDKRAKTITITAPSDFVVRQIIDILQSKLIKRGVDIKSVSWGKPENAAGGNVRQVGTILEGIDRDTAGKINKDIKAQKLKVKVTIEEDKLRVSGPKKDILQEVIQFLKEQDYGRPLQFVNYR